jgi:hypothetical protein
VSGFDPSLARRGLDVLLAVAPHLDLIGAYFPGEQLGLGARMASPLSSPWLRVDLGQPSEGETEAYAIQSYAIWKSTGAVHRMSHGAADEDPFIVPSPVASYNAEVRRVARSEQRVETLRDLLSLALNGVEISADALREMIDESERATTPVEEGT